MKTTSHKTAVKAAVLLAIGTAAMTAAGCASQPKDLQNRTMISWQNSEWGEKRPQWVVNSSSMAKLRAMPEYKDVVCFVGRTRSVNLTFAERWVQSFNVQQQMGEFFLTNTVNMLAAKEAGEANESSKGTANKNVQAASERTAEMDRQIRDQLGTVNVASFSGATREADFWQYVRQYDPDNRKIYSDEYEAFVLYTMPIEQAAKIQEAYAQAVIDKVPELAQIATGVMAEIQSGNLDRMNAAFDETNTQLAQAAEKARAAE